MGAESLKGPPPPQPRARSVAAFVEHQRRKVRLATPDATDGEGACVGGPDARRIALFRIKAPDFPEQGAYFPKQSG